MSHIIGTTESANPKMIGVRETKKSRSCGAISKQKDEAAFRKRYERKSFEHQNASISPRKVRKVIFSSNPESSAGEDGLLYKHLQRSYDVIGRNPDVLYGVSFNFHRRPSFLNGRITRLLPKGGKPQNGKFSFRPITFQPIIWKQLDKIISCRMHADFRSEDADY